MVVWSIACTIILHGTVLAVAACVGAGLMLWVMSIYALTMAVVPRLHSG